MLPIQSRAVMYYNSYIYYLIEINVGKAISTTSLGLDDFTWKGNIEAPDLHPSQINPLAWQRSHS